MNESHSSLLIFPLQTKTTWVGVYVKIRDSPATSPAVTI